MATTRRPKLPRDSRLVEMPDPFLNCRVDRHRLTGEVTMQRWSYPDAETIERRITCVSCGSIQVREIVTYPFTLDLDAGQLYRPTRYDYSDGYLNPEPGTGRIPTNAVRLEAARRWMDVNPLPLTKRRIIHTE